MAPLTAAERQRKRREKLKNEGLYDEYKKKHCLQMQKHRKKKSQKFSKLPVTVQRELKTLEKRKVKDRVAKCRKNKILKQQNEGESNNSIYATRSALGKAVARAKRALPNSPRHKEVVVRKLFSNECNVDLQTCFSNSLPTNRGNKISPDTEIKIINFYANDSISRMAPGRKDVVTIWENGEKKKQQARHLICTIKEAFELFRTEHPTAVVGKSKFFEMRPKHILLSSKLPHNICLCMYHENFINAVNTLHKQNDAVPAYSFKFAEEIICVPPSRKCWFNECQFCRDGNGFQNAFPLPKLEDSDMKWFEWKKNDNQLLKVEQNGSYSDAHQYVIKLIPQFLQHCYIKRHQSITYKATRDRVLSESYPTDTCMVQVDFSENYTCIHQDEIQSAHWQQAQVSLFTAAVYHSGAIHPFVLVSDVLDHSKESVVCYISCLFDNLPSSIKKVEMWSDGPSSQFKNKFIAASLEPLEKKYNLKMKWNYFATSHGKGPVDGIGGSLKRAVFEQVKRRTCIVVDAASFVEAAKKSGTNTNVLEIPETLILAKNKSLNLKEVWEKASQIPGISKYHCIVSNNGYPKGFILSSDVDCESSHEVISDIKCGDWFEVDYEGKLYPGEIVNIVNNEFEVNTMEPIGKHWRWPTVEDKIFYDKLKLIRPLQPPNVVNSRGHFSFNV